MIERLNKIIEEHLDDNNLTNDKIATLLKMSERSFSRKVKAITGKSPNKYILCYRLQRAKDFIDEERYFTVSEISNAIGFATPDYFSHKFKDQFNKTPMQALKEKGLR